MIKKTKDYATLREYGSLLAEKSQALQQAIDAKNVTADVYCKALEVVEIASAIVQSDLPSAFRLVEEPLE